MPRTPRTRTSRESNMRLSESRLPVVRGADARTRNRAFVHARARGAKLAEIAGMTEELMIDRPRERVWRRGVHTVGDEELLATLLGTGVRDHPAHAIAAALVTEVGSVAELA